jgi:hypothetical protein
MVFTMAAAKTHETWGPLTNAPVQSLVVREAFGPISALVLRTGPRTMFSLSPALKSARPCLQSLRLPGETSPDYIKHRILRDAP